MVLNWLLHRGQAGCLVLVLASLAMSFASRLVRRASWATLPSHFKGSVVDQYGNPVTNADIRMRYVHRFKNVDDHIQTDGDGRFSTWLWFSPEVDVTASKAGYAAMPWRNGEMGSREKLRFTTKGHEDHILIDPLNPPVLHVWKQGPLEPVIQVPRCRIMLNAGGVRKQMVFHPDGSDPKHSVEIGFWLIEGKVDSRGRHDWCCEVRVPQGGLQRRWDKFAFIAPESGYTATETTEVSFGERPEWTDTGFMHGDYFVRFDDGIFARFNVAVISRGKGRDQYVMFESVLNPKPGSRNLEVDLNAGRK